MLNDLLELISSVTFLLLSAEEPEARLLMSALVASRDRRRLTGVTSMTVTVTSQLHFCSSCFSISSSKPPTHSLYFCFSDRTLLSLPARTSSGRPDRRTSMLLLSSGSLNSSEARIASNWAYAVKKSLKPASVAVSLFSRLVSADQKPVSSSFTRAFFSAADIPVSTLAISVPPRPMALSRLLFLVGSKSFLPTRALVADLPVLHTADLALSAVHSRHPSAHRRRSSLFSSSVRPSSSAVVCFTKATLLLPLSLMHFKAPP
mmetsp:Transcript_10981/g.30115  ORF Transcript_10981/g.30115 Transcript_10981/m.30115 type:complete len:261 (-) Transcript_10981:1225-2007(-)